MIGMTSLRRGRSRFLGRGLTFALFSLALILLPGGLFAQQAAEADFEDAKTKTEVGS